MSTYSVEDDKKALKKALSGNPFQHNLPNKNLIHDDDMDIKAQLEKRRITSQIISERLASTQYDEVK